MYEYKVECIYKVNNLFYFKKEEIIFATVFLTNILQETLFLIICNVEYSM